MVAGNPDKFAFIVEKVSDRGGCGYINGRMYLYMNGVKYPEESGTVTLDMELNNLINKNSPLVNPVINEELFAMEKKLLFYVLCRETMENGNNFYQLPLGELADAGYYVFVVSSDDRVRIQTGRCRDTNNICYMDETVISKKELTAIVKVLNKIKEQV